MRRGVAIDGFPGESHLTVDAPERVPAREIALAVYRAYYLSDGATITVDGTEVFTEAELTR